MLGALSRRKPRVRHPVALGLAVLRGGLRHFGEVLYSDYLFHPEAEISSYQRWVEQHGSLSWADLRALRERGEGFRVVHYTVLWNHIHAIVEGESHAAFVSGMRALTIRIASSRGEEPPGWTATPSRPRSHRSRFP